MLLQSSLPVQAGPAPAIADLRAMLCSAVVSRHTRRAYLKAFDNLLDLAAQTGRPVSRALMMAYRERMVDEGLSSSTINVRLSAVRKLVHEARDNGLIDPADSVRIASVPCVPHQGLRLGNWLSAEQTRRLLAVPDREALKGKRDYAILCVLVHCALRRSELVALDAKKIQQREGRWVIADLVGKRGRLRTVAIPPAAKAAINEWTAAAGIGSGLVFRRLRKGGFVTEEGLSAWSVWEVVERAALAAGIGRLGAHDLRRSCAKLCRDRGGKIEQIQFLLGHASIETTEKYLGGRQEIAVAVNDDLPISGEVTA